MIMFIDPGMNSCGIYIQGENPFTLFTKKSWVKERKINHIKLSVMTLCKRYKITGVYMEDYAFSRSRITQQAELKGVLQNFFFTENIECDIIPISTWKKKTIGCKVSKKNEANYIQVCCDYAGMEFDTTDEADAYLMAMSLGYEDEHKKY